MDIVFLVLILAIVALVVLLILWRTLVAIMKLRAGESVARTLSQWFKDLFDALFGLG